MRVLVMFDLPVGPFQVICVVSFDVQAAVFNGSSAGLRVVAVSLVVFVGHFEGPEAPIVLLQEIPVVIGVFRVEDNVKGSGFNDVEIGPVDGPEFFWCDHDVILSEMILRCRRDLQGKHQKRCNLSIA